MPDSLQPLHHRTSLLFTTAVYLNDAEDAEELTGTTSPLHAPVQLEYHDEAHAGLVNEVRRHRMSFPKIILSCLSRNMRLERQGFPPCPSKLETLKAHPGPGPRRQGHPPARKMRELCNKKWRDRPRGGDEVL